MYLSYTRVYHLYMWLWNGCITSRRCSFDKYSMTFIRSSRQDYCFRLVGGFLILKNDSFYPNSQFLQNYSASRYLILVCSCSLRKMVFFNHVITISHPVFSRVSSIREFWFMVHWFCSFLLSLLSFYKLICTYSFCTSPYHRWMWIILGEAHSRPLYT